MLINKPKVGETVFWISFDNDITHDNALVMTNYPIPRIHSGKVLSYSYKTGIVKLEVFVSQKFLDNPSFFTTGIKLLKRSKSAMPKAEIGMLTHGLYGSMTEIKLALIKYITSDFNTDEIQ